MRANQRFIPNPSPHICLFTANTGWTIKMRSYERINCRSTLLIEMTKGDFVQAILSPLSTPWPYVRLGCLDQCVKVYGIPSVLVQSR